MSTQPSTAVVLSFHGTVEDLDDMPAFLAAIRRGRPAPSEMVAEVRHRYEQIGGSPYVRETRAQAEALSARLGLPVRIAGRMWGPYAREVVPALHAEGVRRIVSLPLAPQSVDLYHADVRTAAEGLDGLELRFVPAWGDEPALLDAQLETVLEGLARLSGKAGDAPAAETAIVLSAHSLPLRVLRTGDRYEIEFRVMAAKLQARLEALGHPVRVAFQSQGMTGDEWLGPDLPETFRALAAAGLVRVVVAPIGFVAEHVETLYDLDVDAPKLAREAGISAYGRAPTVSARPRFIDALEALVRRALGDAAA